MLYDVLTYFYEQKKSAIGIYKAKILFSFSSIIDLSINLQNQFQTDSLSNRNFNLMARITLSMQ